MGNSIVGFVTPFEFLCSGKERGERREVL